MEARSSSRQTGVHPAPNSKGQHRLPGAGDLGKKSRARRCAARGITQRKRRRPGGGAGDRRADVRDRRCRGLRDGERLHAVDRPVAQRGGHDHDRRCRHRATTTTLNVLHNNHIIYTREQNFGGRQLTEGDPAPLRPIGRRGGHGQTHQAVFGQLYPRSPRAVPKKRWPSRSIARSSFLFGKCLQQRRPRGAGRWQLVVPGIDDLIQARLGVETLLPIRLHGTWRWHRGQPQVLSNDAPALMIACGLAMRSFD